jgi:hypothetical protein
MKPLDILDASKPEVLIMKVKIFWQEFCGKCPPAKELGKTLEAQGVTVEYYDVKQGNGLGEAVYYSLMSTPSVVVTDDNNKEIAKWAGKTPSLDEVKSHLE